MIDQPKDRAPGQLDASWRPFVKLFVGSILGLTLLVYLIVLIVDPYDSVAFSPPWERYPVTSHARPYNAKLARSGQFDSAVVGSSTAMLLKPAELNAEFGGRFANLSMYAASPYEQVRVLELMSYGGAYTGTVIVGLDPSWCAPDGSPQLLKPMAGLSFPEWLYDSSRWNDLPPLNRQTLQHTRSQLLGLLGIRIRHPLRPDGYQDFTKTFRTDHDPETVRQRIYGETPWMLERSRHDAPPSYPELDALAGALGRFPDATLKLAYFVPFHVHHQPRAGTVQDELWTARKTKAARVLREVPNTVLLDFMIPSPITTEDSNYIDGQHYTTAVATDVAHLLHEGALTARTSPIEYRVLSRHDGAR